MLKKYFKNVIMLLSIISYLPAEINVYTHRQYDSDKILFKKFEEIYKLLFGRDLWKLSVSTTHTHRHAKMLTSSWIFHLKNISIKIENFLFL